MFLSGLLLMNEMSSSTEIGLNSDKVTRILGGARENDFAAVKDSVLMSNENIE